MSDTSPDAAKFVVVALTGTVGALVCAMRARTGAPSPLRAHAITALARRYKLRDTLDRMAADQQNADGRQVAKVAVRARRVSRLRARDRTPRVARA